MKWKCGSEFFIESTRANGWWIALIDGNGQIEDTSLDNLRHGQHPKTVKCYECGRRHPNPLHNQE